MKDLDGVSITEAGWYDFTQRQDSDGNIGDGARFMIEIINGNRMIDSIRLTFTDNVLW